jgi:ABC-2 type transport system ATP-binding protein
MNELAIRSEGLAKAYADVPAVDGVNFNVPRGAIYGFLGRNGAGKTTTIKMLLGLTRPTTGSVHIFGMNILSERMPFFSARPLSARKRRFIRR